MTTRSTPASGRATLIKKTEIPALAVLPAAAAPLRKRSEARIKSGSAELAKSVQASPAGAGTAVHAEDAGATELRKGGAEKERGQPAQNSRSDRPAAERGTGGGAYSQGPRSGRVRPSPSPSPSPLRRHGCLPSRRGGIGRGALAAGGGGGEAPGTSSTAKRALAGSGGGGGGGGGVLNENLPAAAAAGETIRTFRRSFPPGRNGEGVGRGASAVAGSASGRNPETARLPLPSLRASAPHSCPRPPVGGTTGGGGGGGGGGGRRLKEAERTRKVQGVVQQVQTPSAAAGVFAGPAKSRAAQQPRINGLAPAATAARAHYGHVSSSEGHRTATDARGSLKLDRDVDTECSAAEEAVKADNKVPLVGWVATTTGGWGTRLRPPPTVGPAGLRTDRQRERRSIPRRVGGERTQERAGSNGLLAYQQLEVLTGSRCRSPLGSSVGSNEAPEAAQVEILPLLPALRGEASRHSYQVPGEVFTVPGPPAVGELPFSAAAAAAAGREAPAPSAQVDRSARERKGEGEAPKVTVRSSAIRDATSVEGGVASAPDSVPEEETRGGKGLPPPSDRGDTTFHPRRQCEVGSRSSSAQGSIALGSAAANGCASTDCHGPARGGAAPATCQGVAAHYPSANASAVKPPFQEGPLPAAANGILKSPARQSLVGRDCCHEGRHPASDLDQDRRADADLLRRSSFPTTWRDQESAAVAANAAVQAQVDRFMVQVQTPSKLGIESPPLGPAALQKGATQGTANGTTTATTPRGRALDPRSVAGSGAVSVSGPAIGKSGVSARLATTISQNGATSTTTVHSVIIADRSCVVHTAAHCADDSRSREQQVVVVRHNDGKEGGVADIGGIERPLAGGGGGGVVLPEQRGPVNTGNKCPPPGDISCSFGQTPSSVMTSSGWKRTRDARGHGHAHDDKAVVRMRQTKEGGGAAHTRTGAEAAAELEPQSSQIARRPGPPAASRAGKVSAHETGIVNALSGGTTPPPARRPTSSPGPAQRPSAAATAAEGPLLDATRDVVHGSQHPARPPAAATARAKSLPDSSSRAAASPHGPWQQRSSAAGATTDMAREIEPVDVRSRSDSAAPARPEGEVLRNQGLSSARASGDGAGGAAAPGPEPEAVVPGKPPGCFCGRLFKGVCRDVRKRIPVYGNDWWDDHPARTATTVLYLLFISIVPAMSLGLYLHLRTDGKTGIVDVISSISLSGVLFSLLGGQPLLRLGVSAPFCCFLTFVHSSAVKLKVEFLPWMGWVGIWATSFVIVAASTDGCCRLSHGVTRFTWDALQVFSSLCLIWDGVGLMVDSFHTGPLGSAAVGLWLAGSVTLAMLFLGAADRWPLFKQAFRARLAAASPLIVVIFFTGLSYAPRLSKIGLPRVPSGGGFLSNGERKLGSFVNISSIPVGKMVMASVPGFFLALLIFVDHTVAAAAVQNPSFNLQKPTVYHWDLLLVGAIMLLCSFLGLPFSYGLFYQSIEHVSSLSITIATSNDEEAGHDTHQIPCTHEQRLSGFFSSILFAAVLVPIADIPIGKIPQAVLLGTIWQMALVLFGRSDIIKRLVHILYNENHSRTITITASERALSQSCQRVPNSVVCNFILLQMVCVVIFFAISRTALSVLSMLLLVVLLVLRQWVLSRAFGPDELAYLDRPALYFHLGVDSPSAGYADINNPAVEPSPPGILSPPADHPGHPFDRGVGPGDSSAPCRDPLSAATRPSSSVPLMPASEYYNQQRPERPRESRQRRTGGSSSKRRRITHPDPVLGSIIPSGVPTQFAVTPDGDPDDVPASERPHIRALRRRIRKNRKLSHGFAISGNRARSWDFPISTGAPGWSPFSSEEAGNHGEPLQQGRFAYSAGDYTSKVFQSHHSSKAISVQKGVFSPGGGPGMIINCTDFVLSTRSPGVTGNVQCPSEDAEETVIQEKGNSQQEREDEGGRVQYGPNFVSEINVLTKKLTPKQASERPGEGIIDPNNGFECQLADDVDSSGRGWYTNVLYEPRGLVRHADTSPCSPMAILPDSCEEFVYDCPLYNSDPNALSLSGGSASSCGEDGGASGSMRSNLGGSLSHAEIFPKDMLRWDGEDGSSSHSARWSRSHLPSPQSYRKSASPAEDGRRHFANPGIDSCSEADGLQPDEQHTWTSRYAPSPLGRTPSSNQTPISLPQFKSSTIPRAPSPLHRASSPHTRVQSPRGQSPSPLARAVLSRSPGGTSRRQVLAKDLLDMASVDKSRLGTDGTTVQGDDPEQARQSTPMACLSPNVAEKGSAGEPSERSWKPFSKPPSSEFLVKSLTPPPVRIRFANSVKSAVIDLPEMVRTPEFRSFPSKRTRDLEEQESSRFEELSSPGRQPPVVTTFMSPDHTAAAGKSHVSGSTFPITGRNQDSAFTVSFGHDLPSERTHAPQSRLAIQNKQHRDASVPSSAEGWQIHHSRMASFLPPGHGEGRLLGMPVCQKTSEVRLHIQASTAPQTPVKANHTAFQVSRHEVNEAVNTGDATAIDQHPFWRPFGGDGPSFRSRPLVIEMASGSACQEAHTSHEGEWHGSLGSSRARSVRTVGLGGRGRHYILQQQEARKPERGSLDYSESNQDSEHVGLMVAKGDENHASEGIGMGT